mgnify:CR=1 FL=1
MNQRVGNIFENRDEIIRLSKNCELYQEANEIKELIRNNYELRDPFYITLSELDQILRFKLRKQYGRQKKVRSKNEEQLVRRVTELALNIDTGNKIYNDEIRTKILCCLRGINISTASAILALTYPEKYAIIDRRNWRYLNPDKPKTNFIIGDYLKYLKILRKLSEKYGIQPQVIDMAIWEKEKTSNK